MKAGGSKEEAGSRRPASEKGTTITLSLVVSRGHIGNSVVGKGWKAGGGRLVSDGLLWMDYFSPQEKDIFSGKQEASGGLY